MRIYLDNNATTPVHPVVLDVLHRCQNEVFGNASSVHEEGRQARRVLERAREQVAGLIHGSPREIVFTSGGTEANNAAISGVLLSGNRGYGVVTTVIEHPSVLEPVRDLASRDHEVTFVPCRSDGTVEAAEVIAAIAPDTRLVTVMLANNETGAIQPVAAIGEACRARNVHFHVDAIQGAGKIEVNAIALNADTVSLSGHKLHAPKGIGALWVRSGSVLHPLLLGGAQERRRRAGTESVPLAAAFGEASRIAEIEADGPAMRTLRDRFELEITRKIPGARIHASGADRLPNTSSILFDRADAEALVIALDLEGVAISTGSACSSGRVEPSHVLRAMGLSEQDARCSVRISLNRFTTSGEIDQVLELLERVVPRIRISLAGHRAN